MIYPLFVVRLLIGDLIRGSWPNSVCGYTEKARKHSEGTYISPGEASHLKRRLLLWSEKLLEKIESWQSLGIEPPVL